MKVKSVKKIKHAGHAGARQGTVKTQMQRLKQALAQRINAMKLAPRGGK